VKKSGYMVLEWTWGRWMVEFTGPWVKVWEGEGLPVFEGDLAGVLELYPELFERMLEEKVIKAV